MRLLVTGAAGFIGSHLVRQFLSNTNWEVVVLDRLDSTVYPARLVEPEVIKHYNRVEFQWWDLKAELNANIIQELGDVNIILHMAASSHVDRSLADPAAFVQDNIVGTVNLLNYARKLKNLQKLVLFSTDEVFVSNDSSVFFSETDAPNPANPYAASKASQELLAQSFASSYQLPIIITRTVNCVGKYQNREKFLPTVVRKILNKETVLIHSDCTKTKPGERYYLSTGEIYSALHFLLLNPATEIITKGQLGSGIYHITDKYKLSNLELAQLIHSIMCNYYREDLEFKYELVDYHSSRPYHDLLYQLSGEKLERLGWRATEDLDIVIKDTVIWYLEHQQYL